MALSKLDNLYRQVILDHSSHPHHHGLLEDSTDQVEMNNPTCGDEIRLQLKIEDGIIQDVRFDGSGCSISTASASMMTDVLIGKTESQALEMAEQFSQMVQGQKVDTSDLGDAAILSGVAKFPARIKCATLGWKALERALDEKEQNEISTIKEAE